MNMPEKLPSDDLFVTTELFVCLLIAPFSTAKGYHSSWVSKWDEPRNLASMITPINTRDVKGCSRGHSHRLVKDLTVCGSFKGEQIASTLSPCPVTMQGPAGGKCATKRKHLTVFIFLWLLFSSCHSQQ